MNDQATLEQPAETAPPARSPFWTVVVVASLIALALVTVMVIAVIVSEIAATDKTDTFSIEGPITEVAIETVGGHVTVQAADIEGVEVVRTSHYSIIEPDGAVDVDGGALSLTDGCTRSVLLIPNCTVDFKVLVPRDAAVEIDGNRTDVSVNAAAGAINIDTTAADIELVGTAGPVTIEAEGSDVTSVELVGPGATVMTNDGSILLDYVEPPGVVAAKTTVGPVTVVVPQASYAVEVDAANGDVEVGVIDDPTSDRRISIANSVGDVAVRPRP